MSRAVEVRRVVIALLDGLRPDAVDAFHLGNVRRLAHGGAFTMNARTVTPSLTWPALTSLFTGVSPAVHGILADSLHLPRPRAQLSPLPQLLARAGYPSTAFMGEIPPLYRGIGTSIAKGLGIAEARFVGANATAVLSAGRSTLRSQRRGLIFFHWGDADRAGHAHGWMSPQYGDAARRLDGALGALASEVFDDRQTLLIALADHGGGGIDHNNHEGDHPLNYTVPLILSGASVRSGELSGASLLDVPATIAWALGVPAPSMYSGRVLVDAFREPDIDFLTAHAPGSTVPRVEGFYGR